MTESKDDSRSKRNSKGGEFLGYYFRKKDPDRKSNINLKIMHGINKISILMFIIGMIYLISKYVF